MNTLLITISEAIEIIEQNFQSERGDSFDLSLTFQDEEGEPVIITDWKIFFTAKQSKDLADNDVGVIAKTFEKNGTAGTAKMKIPPDETKELLGVFFHDAKYIIPNNDVAKTFLRGKWIVTKNVTQRTEELTP